MGFGEAVKSCFNKYFDFKGRARRAEYWYFSLFVILVSTAFSVLDLLIIGVSYDYYNNYGVFGFAELIFTLATIIPGISVTFRRLHDINRSAWWLLLSLVIIIGWIILFIWFCTDGNKEKNRFGPNPKIG